jgi:hypothetical protein
MSDFDTFVALVEEGTKDLAKNTLRGYSEEALQDAKFFLETHKEDARRWTKLLASQDLTQEDFEWLVLSRREVAELKFLKDTGLSMVRMDRFKSALMNLVIDTAFDVFA